ncbi:DUF4855 domain-containing protein [Paenibacillus sp. ACRRX]|uniref:DUF4855 domain-containing protein n=1 Tax=Paenibacillus sp. ACRRX TaxID=2918206 RepID=UPI001EF55F60|nr:DUF4855 domain-containing protein [Paenibacillus sp. ACRRX]MCG7409225.1 DUF4855 domain-containing protein [Paenibacillus sp. ACRRX]
MNTRISNRSGKTWFSMMLTVMLTLSLFSGLFGGIEAHAAKEEREEMESRASSSLSAKNAAFLYSGYFDNNTYYAPYDTNDLTRFDTVKRFIISSGFQNTIDNYEDRKLIKYVDQTVDTITDANSSYRAVLPLPVHDKNIRDTEVDRLFDKYVDYMNEMKNKLGSNWGTVAGFYYPNEAIYYFGSKDYRYSQIKNQPQVKLLEKIAKYINDSAEMKGARSLVWAPYFGYGDNNTRVVETIAYMVDETEIFDRVYIQPHHYFESAPENLDPIYDSVKADKIYGYNGELVAKKHLGYTTVGIQMEIDRKYFESSSYKKRYQDTTDKFKRLEDDDKYFSFYLGAKGTVDRNGNAVQTNDRFKATIDEINNFYN